MALNEILKDLITGNCEHFPYFRDRLTELRDTRQPRESVFRKSSGSPNFGKTKLLPGLVAKIETQNPHLLGYLVNPDGKPIAQFTDFNDGQEFTLKTTKNETIGYGNFDGTFVKEGVENKVNCPSLGRLAYRSKCIQNNKKI